MTGLLHALLDDRAEDVGAPDLDLHAIMRNGERRVRRRRTAWASGVAATAVAAAVTGWAVLPGGAGGDSDLVADGTDRSPVALSWVTGSTLHRVGEADLDLGDDVQAWVWAGRSVAYVDDQGAVHLVSPDGSRESLGKVVRPDHDDAWLVSDADSVSWVDVDDGYTVVDTATDDRHSLADVRASARQGARVTALDAGVVYGVDDRGVFSWDTASGEVAVLDENRSRVVLDAEAGTTVQLRRDRTGRVEGPGRNVELTVDSVANLAPDGALVMAESNDEGLVLDTATGERIQLSTGHDWALPYQWLDDETVAVLAFDGIDGDPEDMSTFLQTCRTATGACDGAGVLVPMRQGSFQLPIGVHFGE